MIPIVPRAWLALSLLITVFPIAHAENGADAWLRYAPLRQSERVRFRSLPSNVIVLGNSPILESAQREIVRGFRGMLGTELVESSAQLKPAIVIGTIARLNAAGANLSVHLQEDGYLLAISKYQGRQCLLVAGANERGVLYGTFALLGKIARSENIASLHEVQQPKAHIRWVDQWDNLDGTIERGYAGRSIFFEDGHVRADLSRINDYARLLASIGINGCSINNVNADPKILSDEFLPQLAHIADIFRRWGIQMSIAVNLASPKTVGGLDSFDPLDPRVVDWWKTRVDQIYRVIPDFGGFVVKADSEGRPGPASYGRTPADAANTIARGLKPHGGIIFYRAFVYNHHLDWTDPKNDRARAAYDIFQPLDGKFDDNVIIQIKHGPIDFQAREPVSPLFGGLRETNDAVELQVTQEYTGQQRHLCFLVPMWKEALDFDFQVEDKDSPLKEIVSGRRFQRMTGGFVGVVNVGQDANWLGHPLAMANLYGFGRLAWDADLTPAAIADEWTRLTFGNDPTVVNTITKMLLASWPAYEKYTGPLGLQTLTDILGSHYGPGIESSERNGWGQWHRADDKGVGMDRSVATGTGFVDQYPPKIARLLESPTTTGDALILFFHHLPYSYRLHSGKTVIQEIYDAHYEGAQTAAEFVDDWKSLKGRIDDERYAATLERLEYQSGHAIVWRDAVCNWFLKASGIPDAQGRVGHYPGRIEAESMRLESYAPIEITPWENASGGKGIECKGAAKCIAAFAFSQGTGRYELDVQYFDQNNGASKFKVYVGDKLIDQWTAGDHLPATKPNGDSSTRRRIPDLDLRTGDEIRVEGYPDGAEFAPLDYVELIPSRSQ